MATNNRLRTKFMPRFSLYTIVLLLILGTACSSSQQVSQPKDDSSSQLEDKQSQLNESMANKLAAVDWDSIQEDLSMPDANYAPRVEYFHQVLEVDEETQAFTRNLGFRIQIGRSRSLAQADSIKGMYTLQMQKEEIAYKAPAYVIYKPPYYRIRVGDFKDRNEALRYNRFLKSWYSASWVVADRIEVDALPKVQDILARPLPAAIDSSISPQKQPSPN